MLHGAIMPRGDPCYNEDDIFVYIFSIRYVRI
jgi:hypothetical protein